MRAAGHLTSNQTPSLSPSPGGFLSTMPLRILGQRRGDCILERSTTRRHQMPHERNSASLVPFNIESYLVFLHFSGRKPLRDKSLVYSVSYAEQVQYEILVIKLAKWHSYYCCELRKTDLFCQSHRSAEQTRYKPVTQIMAEDFVKSTCTIILRVNEVGPC